MQIIHVENISFCNPEKGEHRAQHTNVVSRYTSPNLVLTLKTEEHRADMDLYNLSQDYRYDEIPAAVYHMMPL